MRIESSQLQFASTHALSRRTTTTATLQGPGRAAAPQRPPSPPGWAQALARPAAAPAPAPHAASAPVAAPAAADEAAAADATPNLRLLRLVIEALTGRRLKLLDLREIESGARAGGDSAPAAPAGTPPAAAPARPAAEAVVETTVRESERLSFAAQGVVRTADGAEIRFQAAFELSRDFVQRERIVVREGPPPKDPLVINLAAGAAELTGARFDFDLDADGTAEALPGLRAGSGFLVLDRNGNDAADDGSELFGPASGDGYADLAALDDDGNGWIDEGDAAFAQLRYWAGGAAPLQTLAQAGVGALSVDQQATAFSYRDGANRALGELRATGVWLGEDGSAGTTQQVDLVA